MGGFATAFNEVTLVIFTTLAPAGALACILMLAPVVTDRLVPERQARVDAYLGIPIFVSMAGLVASATHLGTPENALYVFTGVGRSTLSNEVFAAVAFLFLSGMYWLYSFKRQPSRVVQRVWAAAVCASALAFIFSVSIVYAIPTIITWDTSLTLATIAVNALEGGPVLAALGYYVAGQMPRRRMLAASFAALALALATYAAVGVHILPIANSFTTAGQLVPQYWLMVALHVVLCGAGMALAWRAVREGGSSSRGFPTGLLVANILVFGGIFIMRFAFYMSHMTVGLGV